MSLEAQAGSAVSAGALHGCLVEGDPEQRKRERRVRRSALVISVSIQSVILAGLVLLPLFGKPERIALAGVIPLPPYRAPAGHPHVGDTSQNRIPRTISHFYEPMVIPRTIATHGVPSPEPQELGIEGVGRGETPGMGEIPLADARSGVTPPPPPQTHVAPPRVVHVTRLDPAMLIHRVEPLYPALARQIGRGGHVELRAVIAVDGSVQSLQIVSGDPLFYQSALDAVRQWRYSPTVLNGQMVEVDTYITVIYNMLR
jgi:periplasmic protein TonB